MAQTKQQSRKINTKDNKGGKRINPNAPKPVNETNRYIAGACLIALGIILFVVAVLPENTGAITTVFDDFLHLVLGLCAYVLPIILIIIGVSMFIKSKDFTNKKNFVIGMFVIFVGFITLVSMFAPITNAGVEDTALLFTQHNLESYGGYIGNGIGWLFITLFGKVVSTILCILIMVIGVIIAGFSWSTFKTSLFGIVKKKDKEEGEAAIQYKSYEQTKIKLDKNGDIDTSSFEGAAPGKTTVLSNWQEKMADEGKKRQRPVPQTRLATPEDVERAASIAVTNETKQLTRKISDAPSVAAASVAAAPTQVIKTEDEDATEFQAAESKFSLPPMNLLKKPQKQAKAKNSEAVLASTAQTLQQTLEDFGVPASVVGWVAGPTVTLFKVELPAGVRVNRVQNLGTDLALALATPSVRIFAPIPGTNYVGIEVPNANREVVVLSEVLKDAGKGPLEIAIGKDVEGNSVVCDLAKMPHLLIGGTTGSGKSVSVNAMIMSILMRATPDDVRLIMIDPKRVEFTPYNGIPHLYVPVVTEPKEAASALSWGVAEMERRLKLMSEAHARNIKEYNAKVATGELDDIKKQTSDGLSEEKKHVHLPYIVIIIDELADLMMSVGKEVEMSICRIAQLARAAGIHLIVATQRPSTNVVTGLIKSNITNRIAFNVASSIDSRVILDTTGAEDLIGLGDLLLSKPEFGKPIRIQGCFVSEEEISSVVGFIKEQGEPEYNNAILQTNLITIGDSQTYPKGSTGDEDPLLWEAAELVVSSGMGSTSNVQRKLSVGYARAGRIMDQLEEKGIVGPANGSKPREVLVDELELESVKAFEQND